jgi:hypothetical protein
MLARGRMEEMGVAPGARIAATVALLLGFTFAFSPRIYLLHEAWAAVFLGLALAVYKPSRWPLSVGLAVLACLFRELAAPVLGVMGFFALIEGRPREAAGWGAGLVVFAACYAAHLALASQLYRPGDLISPGWLAFGGLPFVFETARRCVPLGLGATPIVALGALAGLTGLAGSRNPLAARCALIVGGYMGALMVVGRPDNGYWGLLYAPLLPLGILLFPAALRDLMAASSVKAHRLAC